VATSSSPAEGASGGPDGSHIEVAVIGSARIAHDDPRYADAERLGRAIAAEGWTLVTGGYGGLMGAAAEGAVAGGGRAVGLPMSAWHHLTPHASNAELRWSRDYAERLNHLLAADVVVALPGGVGTLSEASLVWAAAQTEVDTAALVVVGDGWADLLRAFGARLLIDDRDLAIARWAATVDDVVGLSRAAIAEPKRRRAARG
jgi:uncharacterized protein (TIGR00730 family)